MNPTKQKAARRAIFIALLGIAIGFLGELMPDALKEKVESFTTNTLGWSYESAWIVIVAIICLLTIVWVWRDTMQQTEEEQPTASDAKIHVEQHGKKSVFINKNKGDININ